MGQRKRGPRALGPYRHGNKWRVVTIDDGGKKTAHPYATEAEARRVLRDLAKLQEGNDGVSLNDALGRYETYLQDDKGNKRNSIATTIARLKSFFPDREMLLRELSPSRCQSNYDQLRRKAVGRTKQTTSVDTHRNTLAEVRTFLNWCAAKGWVRKNLMSDIKGTGRRKKGKAQLRIDEARLWFAKAKELADAGDLGAIAALITLSMGLRSFEIIERVVRDVDDNCCLLWIPNSKTQAGKRTVEIPVILQPYFKELSEGREPDQLLFGHHWTDWVRKSVQRICRAAGVPEVSAQAMRGLHGTLAEESGVSAHAVARTLGHESTTTTHAHYTQKSAVDNAKQRRVTARLHENGDADDC